MGSRFFWIGAILLGGLFFWAVGYVVKPNGGDVEFQKMLEAMKQVKTSRQLRRGHREQPALGKALGGGLYSEYRPQAFPRVDKRRQSRGSDGRSVPRGQRPDVHSPQRRILGAQQIHIPALFRQLVLREHRAGLRSRSAGSCPRDAAERNLWRGRQENGQWCPLPGLEFYDAFRHLGPERHGVHRNGRPSAV